MIDTGEILAKACALQGLRRFDEALDLLRQGLALEPDNGGLLAAAATSMHLLGQLEEALAAADAALAAQPDLVDAHVARSWILLDLVGGAEQALESAAAAVDLAPWYEPALQVLANSCLALGDVAGAEAVAQAMLAQHPLSADGRFILGTAAILRGDWTTAEENLTAVLGMVPESAETLANLALVALHTGRHDLATDRFRQAARLMPDEESGARIAGSMVDGVEARLLAEHTPGQAAAMLLDEIRRADPARPFFVTAMMTALAGSLLLRAGDGDPAANMVAGVDLLESVAAADPGEHVPPAAPRSREPVGNVADLDGEVVALELQAAAWLGGPHFREGLRVGWLQDAAEANLVAVPVAGDRNGRVERCLELMKAFAEGGEEQREPFVEARMHLIAGRAAGMRTDGERVENVQRAVEHFAAAREIYLRIRAVGMSATAELYLGATMLDLPPDDEGRIHEAAFSHLESTLRSPTIQANPRELAMVRAAMGEGLYNRLKILGREQDFDPAVEHLTNAAEIFGSLGHAVGQAHYLEFQARCWLIRPRGDVSENVERAIELLGQALDLVTRSGAPTRWAGLQACMSRALLLASPHGLVASADRAVEHALLSVEDLDALSDPMDWARNTKALALALAARADVAPCREGADDDARSAVKLMREVVPVLLQRSNLPDVADVYREAASVLRVAACHLSDYPLEEMLGEAWAGLGAGLEIAESHRLLRTATLLRLERARLALTATELTGATHDPRPDLEHAHRFFASTGDEHRAAAVLAQLDGLVSSRPSVLTGQVDGV